MSKHVTTSELKDAKLAWIKDNQRTLDEKKLQELSNDLNLKRDDDGVIRSYSRLKNAKIPFNMKAPIFVNRDHRLAEILVYYYHLKVLHRGVKQTLTELRSNYWITRGRSFVKKLLHPCGVCKKLNSRPYYYPEHSDLPELRFDDRYPFSSTGMDYLGPLYCYPVYGDSSEVNKAYIALFTCASTRAVSLEVVHDGEATTFTNAFSRFVARRGCPNVVVSDNGPTFDSTETKTFLANHFIEWKPILEAAPWWGGMYERLVASVKRCIKKVVGVHTLTYIELQTLASEIELILNNRPIGDDYDDDVEEVLTPNHLIFGRMLSTSGDQQFLSGVHTGGNLAKRKRALNTIIDHFWNRWRREYVTSLREVQRLHKRGGETIQKDDVVIVFDEKVPRHMWRIAKVEKLIPSESDGLVRGAVIKLAKTGNLIRRPVNKLYPFIQNDTSDDSDIRSVSKSRRRTDDDNRNVSEAINEDEGSEKTSVSDVPPNEGVISENDVNVHDSSIEDDISDFGMNPNAVPVRARREAAIMGELRRRLMIE